MGRSAAVAGLAAGLDLAMFGARLPRRSPPPRRWRAPNPALGAVAALLFVVVAVGICEAFEWPFLREPLERRLAAALQRPVTLAEPFGARLLGTVRVRSSELRIGPPAREASSPSRISTDGAAPPDLLRAGDARVAVSYRTLWRLSREGATAALHVDALDVGTLALELRRGADGRTNWDLGPAHGAQKTEPTTEPRTQQKSEGEPTERAGWPTFGLLRVRGGTVHLVDALNAADLRAHVHTHEGRSARNAAGTSGGLRIELEGVWRDQPVAGRLESSGLLPLLRAEAGEAGEPIRAEVRSGRSRLHLQGRANDVVRLAGFNGQFELAGTSLAAIGTALGLTLPNTAEFKMRGRVVKDGRVWQADIPQWQVGSSRLQAAFRYDPRPAVPLLSGRLGGARLVMADLGPALGAGPDEPAPAARRGPRGRVLPVREFHIPSLRRMEADVQIGLAHFDLGTRALQPLAPLRGRLQLRGGVLSITDLLATAAAGTVHGEIVLDAREAGRASEAAAPPPRWAADLRWSGIQLSRWITARAGDADGERRAGARRGERAKAAAGSDRAARSAAGGTDTDDRADEAYVTGSLGGAVRVVGHGRSMAAVLGSLDGTATLFVRDGELSHLVVELAGLDLAEGLGLMVSGDRRLPMRCAVARFALRDGRARPDVAIVDTPDSTLLVAGGLSLADETLALQVRALPHDVSPFALRSPIHIRGSFAEPEIVLDKPSIARRIARATALALVAPPAALLALFDLGEADRDRCHEAFARLRGPADAAARPPARRPEPAR